MDNDDAEYARREMAYEMGDTPEDIRWQKWVDTAAGILIAYGCTTPAVGLDGDQIEDGFSLDFAHDAYRVGTSAEDYAEKILCDWGYY